MEIIETLNNILKFLTEDWEKLEAPLILLAAVSVVTPLTKSLATRCISNCAKIKASYEGTVRDLAHGAISAISIIIIVFGSIWTFKNSLITDTGMQDDIDNLSKQLFPKGKDPLLQQIEALKFNNKIHLDLYMKESYVPKEDLEFYEKCLYSKIRRVDGFGTVSKECQEREDYFEIKKNT